MSTFSYAGALKKLHDEIKDNYDLIREENKLDANPAPDSDVRASWPEEVKSFYKEISSAHIHWGHLDHEDEANVSGRLRLRPAKDVGSDGKGLIWFDHTEEDSLLKKFRIIDFFIDEAAAGFYDGGDGEMHLYMFEADPIPLGVKFDAYVQLMCEARGFFYWQQVLIAIKTQIDNSEAANFRTHMPEIFPNFKYEDFVALYNKLKS